MLYWIVESKQKELADNVISLLEKDKEIKNNQDLKKIVDEIKNRYTNSQNKNFNPVLNLNKDPSSIERLSLLIYYTNEINDFIAYFTFHDIIAKSVEECDGKSIDLFKNVLSLQKSLKSVFFLAFV